MNVIQRWLNQYLTVQAEDAIVRQRQRSFLILLLIMAVASVLSMFQVLIFYPEPQSMILMIITIILIVALAWFAHRQHRWPPYVFLVFMIIAIPYEFSEDINSPMSLLLVLPVVVAPLIASPWVVWPVTAVQTIMLYALVGSEEMGILPFIIFGILGGVAWFSNATLVSSVKESQENAESLAEINEELLERQEELHERTEDLERRTDRKSVV